jgi:hypothetical protein
MEWKGYGGGKGEDKGNRSHSGDTLSPFKDMECSHCGKKGHPARNYYKRLNAQPTALSQNTTIITEPANTIAFQQYVTYMKRKAKKQASVYETEKHEGEDDDTTNIAPDLAPTHQSPDDWGSSSATVEPTWGRTSTQQYEEVQHR